MSSARGQSYAEEVRQLYEAALRQKQLPRQPQQQHQQHQSAAVSGCDDDAVSTTTTSTSTAVMTAVGGLCWRCCRGSDDVEMRIRGRREMGSGSAGGRGRIGRWSSTGDCESIGSGSEFATAGSPTGVCGALSVASVSTSPAGSRQIGLPNAVLPDVVALAHNDEPDNRREHQRGGSTSTVNYKPKKDEAHQVFSAAGHVAR